MPSVPAARIVADLPHPIREIENIFIPMADGVQLACRIWLPADADQTPVPALLEYIPYRKRDGTKARDEAMHPFFAGHGYAAVRVDLRGAGDSDGQLHGEYLARELDDAVAVIAWIAAQPWCTGRVGMVGKSWGGFNCFQVAALRPPALAAVVPVYFTDDRYADDIHTMGGCQLLQNPGWSFTMFSYAARPPDPKYLGRRWRAAWRQRLDCARPWILDWLRHQRRDGFWKHGSVGEDFSRVQCPVYAIGGWADGYSNPVPRVLAGLSVPRRGLVGPWGHQFPHQARPGPAIGFMAETLRWWDHWLKDIDTGIMDEPMYRVWMSDSAPPDPGCASRPGRWVAEPGWPSDSVQPQIWAVTPTGLSPQASPGPGDTGPGGTVTVRVPQTYGRCTPYWLNYGTEAPEGALDQRPDDALAFTADTAPLPAAVAILGAPVLRARLAVDQPVAFVSVRLCDVLPDGRSGLVTYGLLNLTHDRHHETVTPLVPGRLHDVAIVLSDSAHRFAAGNRIRVAVAPAFWPVAWPSPAPVTLTLCCDATSLVLPLRPDRPEDADLRPMDPPQHSPVHPVEIVRDARLFSAGFEQDPATGIVTQVTERDSGVRRDVRDGWTVGESVVERYAIHPDDPLSARARWQAHGRYGRDTGGPDVRIDATQDMTCSADAFRVQARLRVTDGGAVMLDRHWDETIPRDGV